MEKYKDLSDNVVSLLGGKENISFYTHCVTRLRFNVKDRSLVEKEKIDSLEKVVGSQWSGEQFQIIIGQSVKEAYNAIEEKNHVAQKDDETVENTQSDNKRKLSFNSILDGLAGCITPLIPLMIGSIVGHLFSPFPCFEHFSSLTIFSFLSFSLSSLFRTFLICFLFLSYFLL